MVLDKCHQPLQPCSPARARQLLQRGRAVVHRHTPFVIRLKDRTVVESDVDGVEVGIDPGSRHTGISLFTTQAGERRARFSVQLDHRGPTIRQRMEQRASFRRRRRSSNLRYRAPRFHNRCRSEGWVAPSLKHRVVTTASWVDRLCRWAPVRASHVEQVVFDTRALSSDPLFEENQSQQGTLRGTEVREYLLANWNHQCAYCGVQHVPLNIDHIAPKSRGGTDRVSNLTVACIPCNQAKSNRSVEDFLASKPKVLARLLAQAKSPLKDAAAVNSTRQALRRELDTRLPTHGDSGGRTKWNRVRNHLPKTHTLDALSVGKFDTVTEMVSKVLVVGCTGRGTHTRTRSDRYGFPRLRMPRQKAFFGYRTGDLVKAVIPSGKYAGTHTGRVMVRSSGRHRVPAPGGHVDTSHTNLRLLQRADGYTYTIRKEVCAV
ncbi:RNA-guided endonuclease IscB [Streptomyces sp. NPDC056296]|uniref:RNA-guided endonuclease IscB n=1 Tax=Streptomyces sp. NPDC056296 TaxID=3345775 RepID=UPI0035D8815E